MKSILFVFFFLLCNQSYAGGFTDGNDLYKNLADYRSTTPTNYISSSAAFGYVIGVADSFDGVKRSQNSFCIPNNANKRQMIDVVYFYLDKNPQLRQYQASGLVEIALSQAFPCR